MVKYTGVGVFYGIAFGALLQVGADWATNGAFSQHIHNYKIYGIDAINVFYGAALCYGAAVGAMCDVRIPGRAPPIRIEQDNTESIEASIT